MDFLTFVYYAILITVLLAILTALFVVIRRRNREGMM